MHQAAFARAALPAPFTVLGMSLGTYTIGHELWLGRICPDGISTDKAFVRAVLICCEDWEGARRLDSDWLLRLKAAILTWRLWRDGREEAMRAFKAYREEGSLEFPLSPPIVQAGSGTPTRPPGSPFLIRLTVFLMTRLRISQAEAWKYPLALAKMQWAAYWEEEGGLQVYNWQDAEHDAFVAQCEAEDAAAAQAAQSPKPEVRKEAERTPSPQPPVTRLDCVATEGCKVSLPTRAGGRLD